VWFRWRFRDSHRTIVAQMFLFCKWLILDMKLSNSSILFGTIGLLAIGFSIASLRYVRPLNCVTFCDLPEQLTCPSGSCRPGEQRAGFPLPIILDSGTGSSPTSGWGKLGPEDLPNPVTPILDVIFYGVLLWIIWKIFRALLGREKPSSLWPIAPFLFLELAFLLLGYMLRPR
jgi:hypothetical protein